jgi:indolepyruvate ferredoxin oxidoreductase
VQVEKNLAAFEWGRRAAHDVEAVRRIVNSQGSGAAQGGTSKIIALHTPKALDKLIEKRLAYLADYQNEAYAARYGRLVAQVRTAEAELGSNEGQYPLTEAVAKNLHKLMAYKDEYEVARLYADPAFVEKLKGSFEGDWKIKFHLAPPAFSKKDAKGHLVKKQYGQWVLPAMRVLAKLKFLRGTALDVFGKTEERRMERALIVEYEGLVKELIAGLTLPKLALAIELASLPDSMRGYGHVKDNNVQAAKTKWNALLVRWREGQNGEARQVA